MARITIGTGQWVDLRGDINSNFTELYASLGVLIPDVNRFLTVDQLTTSNVATNITDLVFPVLANKKYKISGNIRVGCNNSGGVQLGLTFPTGSTPIINIFGRTTNNTTFVQGYLSASGLSSIVFNNVNSAAGFVNLEGTIDVGGTSGNLQLQFASAVNGQTSTIFATGTILTLTQLT